MRTLTKCTEKQIKIVLIDYFIPTFQLEGLSTVSTTKLTGGGAIAPESSAAPCMIEIPLF